MGETQFKNVLNRWEKSLHLHNRTEVRCISFRNGQIKELQQGGFSFSHFSISWICLIFSSSVGFLHVLDLNLLQIWDRIMPTLLQSHCHPLNLQICCLTWQRRIKIADGIKTVNQLTLNYGCYPGFSGWAQRNHNGP